MIPFGLYWAAWLFAGERSYYKCDGTITGKPQGSNTRIFFELREYRKWASWLSNSDGYMMLQLPSQTLEWHSEIQDDGAKFQILNEDFSVVGQFSKASGNLSIQSLDGFFDGNCDFADPLWVDAN